MRSQLIHLSYSLLHAPTSRLKGFDDSDKYDDWLRNMKWAHPDEKHLALLMKVCPLSCKNLLCIAELSSQFVAP